MESLLPAFIAVVLAEMGSRVQHRAAHLSSAYDGSSAVMLALLTTTLIYLCVAGFAGVWVADNLNYHARTMLLGLALIFAAVGVAWPKKAKPLPVGGSTYLTSVRQFGFAQFGDNSQFLVFAFAARGDAPVLAALSGTAGVIASAFIPYVAPDEWKMLLRLRYARWAVSLALLIAGCTALLWALRVIG